MNIDRIEALRSRDIRKKRELELAREKRNQIRLETLSKKRSEQMATEAYAAF
jgi:hypothetical protein